MHSLAFLHGQCQLALDCRCTRTDNPNTLLGNATKRYAKQTFVLIEYDYFYDILMHVFEGIFFIANIII